MFKKSTLIISFLENCFSYDINDQKYFFLLAGYKVDFIAPCGEKNSFSDPLVEKKSCATREKHLFYSCRCYPRFARASNFTLPK